MSSLPAATKGGWFLTLFAAEEMPAAIVTYVSLLMFLQLGVGSAAATLLSAMLFLPWVLKSFMRSWVRRVGNFRSQLYLIEALLFMNLMLLAFSFMRGPIAIFAALFGVSLLCAWHELAARMYYERMLRPALQRLFTPAKLVCSQASIIFTYGALIFLVGTLQVYFRQMISFSWQLGCYVAAGIFLLFAFHHLVWLQTPRVGDEGTKHSLGGSVKAELRVIDRIRQQRGWWRPVGILFLLLLPQGLMFHARVLYLYIPEAMGGLQCTMQEIGFAQGTIGVIAFSIGLFLGRRLFEALKNERGRANKGQWSSLSGGQLSADCETGKSPSHEMKGFSFVALHFSLLLSPFVYLAMTIWPPQALWQLCLCTLAAQFFFGFGLSICRLPVGIISGGRYRNTINILQIPLVSAVLIMPMAVSGWLVEQWGFATYFLVNALCGPVCLLGVFLLKRREIPPSI